MDYKMAGVDIEAGYRAVELIKRHVQSTNRMGVLGGLGNFGGMFSLGAFKDMEEPVLVSGTDGVGTKLKLAFLMDSHDKIGIDCVAMCVNDIICCGAEPLFFLDYIACSKNVPERIEDIVKGIAEGCRMANVALVGGETAEMPGFYSADEYDIAGFSVGIVDKKKILDSSKVKVGSALIGIRSNGLHSNGFSLVRKIFTPTTDKLSQFIVSLGCTLGEAVFSPTKIYVQPVMKLLKEAPEAVFAIANITGGGFYENIPRILQPGQGAKIIKGSWDMHPIFGYLQNMGNLSETVMYNTFNMGIGMVAAVAPTEVDACIKILTEAGEQAYLIGEVIDGEGVTLC